MIGPIILLIAAVLGFIASMIAMKRDESDSYVASRLWGTAAFSCLVAACAVFFMITIMVFG